MTINVYSKPGCGLCEAAKDKLKIMGFSYNEHNLGYHVEHHEGWREDGSIEVLAAHSAMDTMPLIQVDGEFYNYSAAMKTLKKFKKMGAAEVKREAVLA